jgi:uncharacterized protein YbjT (DUF2867 family)
MVTSPPIPLAVLTGATGLVGAELLRMLLDDPGVERIVSIGRRRTGQAHPKLREIVLDDLSQLEELDEDLRHGSFFCCLGTTIKKAGSKTAFRRVDFDAVLSFGKLAGKQEARSLAVVSASGASARSRLFYSRVKGETEEALTALSLNSLILLRPSLLLGERQEKRTAEGIAIAAYKLLSPLLPAAMRALAGTDARRVAQAMLEASRKAPPGLTTLGPRELGL